jgi:hypothetical protein
MKYVNLPLIINKTELIYKCKQSFLSKSVYLMHVGV